MINCDKLIIYFKLLRIAKSQGALAHEDLANLWIAEQSDQNLVMSEMFKLNLFKQE